MVRRAITRAAGARVLALLCAAGAASAVLSACELWNLALSSTFPVAATQVTAIRDLSSLVPAADASSYFMSNVVTGGQEYLVLSSPLTTDGVRLIVMDTGLTVLLTLSAQDVAGRGGTLGTSPAKVDTQGNVVVGDMNVANASGLILPPNVNLLIAQGVGFATSGGYDIAGLTTSGNGLDYIRYDTGSWAQDGWYGSFDILTSPTVDTNFTIRAVFPDPDPARQLVLLVLTDTSRNLDYYFSFPLADFASGFLAFPYQTYYPYFTKPATDTGLLGYANGGFIRFDPSGSGSGGRSGAFVRTDLGGTDMSMRLPYDKLPDVCAAYSPSGAFYFLFDRGTRRVTRMAAWWN